MNGWALRNAREANSIAGLSSSEDGNRMRLVEILQSRKHALRVSEVATLFSVTDQHSTKWQRGEFFRP
jgi:hypothetical protein